MAMKTNRTRKSTAASKKGARLSNLADALFSRTQQRILALLFGQPQRSYFATELIGLARSGTGAVQRELDSLAQSGLVTITRLGNQKHFQANPSSPIFQELRGIIVKTVGLVGPLKAALAQIEPRLKLAVVYGSVAKGTDTASSDIDLLIVSDEIALEQIYSAIAPAEHELARTISPTLYTTSEFARRRKSGDSFVTKVLTGEHIVLVEKERGVTTAR